MIQKSLILLFPYLTTIIALKAFMLENIKLPVMTYGQDQLYIVGLLVLGVIFTVFLTKIRNQKVAKLYGYLFYAYAIVSSFVYALIFFNYSQYFVVAVGTLAIIYILLTHHGYEISNSTVYLFFITPVFVVSLITLFKFQPYISLT